MILKKKQTQQIKDNWTDLSGFYKTVTEHWIKRQILKAYLPGKEENNENFKDNMTRKLIKIECKCNYKKTGYYLFGLDGSPPKGCAIYQPDHQWLMIISAWGTPKTYKNIFVDGCGWREE